MKTGNGRVFEVGVCAGASGGYLALTDYHTVWGGGEGHVICDCCVEAIFAVNKHFVVVYLSWSRASLYPLVCLLSSRS